MRHSWYSSLDSYFLTIIEVVVSIRCLFLYSYSALSRPKERRMLLRPILWRAEPATRQGIWSSVYPVGSCYASIFYVFWFLICWHFGVPGLFETFALLILGVFRYFHCTEYSCIILRDFFFSWLFIICAAFDVKFLHLLFHFNAEVYYNCHATVSINSYRKVLLPPQFCFSFPLIIYITLNF